MWGLADGLATVPLAAVVAVALSAGTRIRDRVDGKTYRQWLRVLLLVVALVLVLQFLGDVLTA